MFLPPRTVAPVALLDVSSHDRPGHVADGSRALPVDDAAFLHDRAVACLSIEKEEDVFSKFPSFSAKQERINNLARPFANWKEL
jgi:hypothetical protein